MKKGICITPKEMGEGLTERLRAEGITLVILRPEAEEGSVLGLEWLCRDVKFGRYHQPMLELKNAGVEVEYGAHTASSFLPRAFFGVHPYWFRMNERGERTADANFCPSAREAMEYISWRAGSVGATLRSTDHRYHFLPDADAEAICHCPACRHLTPAEQRMIYARSVLRGLREKDPKAEVCYPVFEDDTTLPRQREEGIFLSCTAKALKKHGDALLARFQPERVHVTGTDESFFREWTEPPFYSVVVERSEL